MLLNQSEDSHVSFLSPGTQGSARTWRCSLQEVTVMQRLWPLNPSWGDLTLRYLGSIIESSQSMILAAKQNYLPQIHGSLKWLRHNFIIRVLKEMQHITHEDAFEHCFKGLQLGYPPKNASLLGQPFLCQDHVSAEQIKSALEQVGHSFHIEDAPWFGFVLKQVRMFKTKQTGFCTHYIDTLIHSSHHILYQTRYICSLLAPVLYDPMLCLFIIFFNHKSDLKDGRIHTKYSV